MKEDTRTDDCGWLIIISVIILLIALASCRSKKETIHNEYSKTENTQVKDSVITVSVKNEKENQITFDKSRFNLKVTELYFDTLGNIRYQRDTDYSQHNDKQSLVNKEISDSSNMISNKNVSENIIEESNATKEVKHETKWYVYFIFFSAVLGFIVCVVRALYGWFKPH